MNNFVIEQYLIRAISKEENRYYILKKYSATGVTIKRSNGKESQMINIYESENDDVGKVVYKYYNLIRDCNLKYAEKALANTILRNITLNIKELIIMEIVIGFVMNMLCMEIKLVKVQNYMKKS